MKNNLFRNLIVLLIIVFVGFLVLNYNDKSEGVVSTQKTNVVYVNDTPIKVEYANTLEKQTQGLSGRDSLAEGEGMLFTFEKVDLYKFWMKDMKFSIDMIWFGEDQKVMYIKENATPESYPEVFGPEENSKYVLEVPAGFAQKNNIKLGDSLNLVN